MKLSPRWFGLGIVILLFVDVGSLFPAPGSGFKFNFYGVGFPAGRIIDNRFFTTSLFLPKFPHCIASHRQAMITGTVGMAVSSINNDVVQFSRNNTPAQLAICVGFC